MDELLAEFRAEYPELTDDHRTYLVDIARGYRVMARNGGLRGVLPSAEWSDLWSVVSDEWLCGSYVFADACRSIQKLVGVEAEMSITHRICKSEDALVLKEKFSILSWLGLRRVG